MTNRAHPNRLESRDSHHSLHPAARATAPLRQAFWERDGVLFGEFRVGGRLREGDCHRFLPAAARATAVLSWERDCLGKGTEYFPERPPPTIQGFWERDGVVLREAPRRGQSPFPSCSRPSYGCAGPGVLGRGRSTSEGKVLPKSQGFWEGESVLFGATSAGDSRHFPWCRAQSSAALRGASWERDGVVWGEGRVGDSHHLLRAAA